MTSYVRRGREILDIEIAELQRVRDDLDGGFTRAVETILPRLVAGGKIVLTGVGKNLPIAQKIAATLSSTGSPAVVLHPSDAMHGDLGIVQPGDTVLALSYSGASDELLALIPAVRRFAVPVIAMTGDPEGPLARVSDVVLVVRVSREACPFNMAPTASTTATLAVGDALAMVLLDARGFRREDYAKLHPGGAIGRALLLRVRDIMRTGDRVALVPREALVRDAVVAMTGARAGSVAVVDAGGRLAGIFTDGDLRRHMTGEGNLGARPVAEVMTANPIRVRDDQLAVDVLATFEKYAIDDLVVIDATERVVGMIDLQDLPRVKIL
ncbi:MAG: KpsF/GutQ family sugar-phosphate isomerase [Lentisphaerae bacterium]|nr:KpsF/GutQ family sugar-phosphate isomerase [Lentisphaerota bacterium]